MTRKSGILLYYRGSIWTWDLGGVVNGQWSIVIGHWGLGIRTWGLGLRGFVL
jgi:hypothetical protein